MKLSLLVLQGSAEGREIPIRLSQFIIGRDPECQLRPASPLVSKRHCAIMVRAERAFVRDFDSTNGTLVNRQPINGETEIKDGDELKIGPLLFRVRIGAGVSPVEAAPETPRVAAKEPPIPAQSGAGKVGFDEESLMDMLLNESGSAQVPAGGDPVPGGSTIMEGLNVETSTPEDAPKDKSDSKKIKPKIDAASTANAAKAILDKYMRRPRT